MGREGREDKHEGKRKRRKEIKKEGERREVDNTRKEAFFQSQHISSHNTLTSCIRYKVSQCTRNR